ncbi:MAG: methyltransferase domain-containing protein [Candidatus Dormibacteraeota bacterium]|nr:methyltransferase domain-containing protein [Candidatus Dormibacteraeota bacterium]
MRWNAPLSLPHAESLLHQLQLADAATLVDLGCGWGELLLQAAAMHPALHCEGIDNQAWAIERARGATVERGLAARVRFRLQDATTWDGSAHRLMCIGSSHAWGGSSQALRALAARSAPGGYLLYGDGCWEHGRPPADAVAIFGDGVLRLGDLAAEAVAAGWRVMHSSTADLREWDEFESSWRDGREHWLRTNADDPAAEELRQLVERRLREYLDVYRGVLGFAYLVLRK